MSSVRAALVAALLCACSKTGGGAPTGTPGGAPLAPTNLTVATDATGTVVLTWAASQFATKYQVLRSATSGSGYTALGAAVTGTTTTDGTAAPSTTYYYVVQASNDAGSSGNSNEAAMGTPGAAPTGFTAVVDGQSHVQLSWSGSASAFAVQRADGASGTFAHYATSPDVFYEDDYAAPGAVYRYRVRSSAAGGNSAPSSEVTVTIPATAPAPLAPTHVTAQIDGNGQVQLNWDGMPDSPDSYTVLRSMTAGNYTQLVAGVFAPPYNDTTVTAGSTYHYVVQSVLGTLTSGNSADASIAVTAGAHAPLPPQLTVSSNGTANVSSAGATSYTLSRAASVSGQYSVVATGSANLVDPSPPLGSTAYYTATATNAGGTSAASPAVVLIIAPAAPAAVQATADGSNNITISWNASAGATSYLVRRSYYTGVTYSAYSDLLTTTATTAIDPAADAGSYRYAVYALAGAATGSRRVSTPVTISSQAGPTALRAAGADSMVLLRWVAATGSPSYTVQRATIGNAYATIGTTSNTYFADTNVATGNTYNYVVIANGVTTPQVSAQASGVALTGTITLMGEGGVTTTAPLNMDSLSLSAVVGTTAYPALSAPGYAVLPGVPATSYLLRYNRNRYNSLSARIVDLSQTVAGRANEIPAVSGTAAAFNLSGLDAWKSSDVLEWISLGAGDSNFYLDQWTYSPVAPGSTSFTGTLDFRSAGLNLIDGSKSDRMTLSQLHTLSSAKGLAYQGLTHVFQPPSFTMTAGASTPLTGSLSAVPASSQTTLTYLRSQFKSHAAEVSPAAVSESDSLVIDALPAYSTRGFFTNSPDLAIVATDTATADLDFGSVSYGNPFSGWDSFIVWNGTFVTRFVAPGANYGGAHAFAFIGSQLPLADATTGALAPLLSPPRSLQINDQAATADRTAVTTTPTLSWSAPALGTPTDYGVTIRQVQNYYGSTLLVRALVAWTPGTTFTVPANVLRPGDVYVATITARLRDGTSIFSAPFRAPVHYSYADALTATFTP